MGLVIKSFEFNKDLDDDGKLLEIEARNSGWQAILLGFLGLDERSYLKVTKKEVEVKTVGLEGITYIIAPFDSITCMVTGVTKPRRQLFFGIFLVLFGLWQILVNTMDVPMFLVMIVGGALIFNYYRTKDLLIAFSTGDIPATRGLSFNQGTVDGKKVDYDTLLEVIEHINILVMDVHAIREIH